jgi:hypothetical protein
VGQPSEDRTKINLFLEVRARTILRYKLNFIVGAAEKSEDTLVEVPNNLAGFVGI